ncbi:MAG: type-F conjugative transfer system protein TraW [Rhodocyclaceae bacterium]|nr:type-F conjugative transfer system protein TraW [Rhodocyclaceae bacterium]
MTLSCLLHRLVVPLAAAFLVSLAIFISRPALATEQIGPVYPIAEPDMLQEIERRLKEKERSGELARLQKEAIERSKQSVETPRPVQGLAAAERNRTFYYDPTYRVPQTIRDTEGNVVVAEGTTINPLDYISVPEYLLFFDGRDARQVAMAVSIMEHYKGQIKPILIGGAVLEMSRQWKRQVYFDQGGVLVRKLGITRVPSLVTQEGKKLRIDELGVI